MQNYCSITFEIMWKQPPEKLCRKAVLKILQYSKENTCVGDSNSEYCKIFQRTYSEEHLQTAASENVHETEKNQKLLIRDFNST